LTLKIKTRKIEHSEFIRLLYRIHDLSGIGYPDDKPKDAEYNRRSPNGTQQTFPLLIASD